MKKSVTSLLILLSSVIIAAGQTQGRVIAVADGDTFTVLFDDLSKQRIRISGIDAPESSQPFGSAAKKELSKQIFGHRVTLRKQSEDKYGRWICKVYLDNKDIGLHMIREGYAWHYSHFDKDKSYAKTEREARRLKKGLWSDKNPINPFEWRKAHKK